MQIVFDRYVPRGGARHLDLATGRPVDVIVRDVPSEDWRRRWRARVETLLEGCDGLERLVDAGDAGRHAVFEVRAEPFDSRSACRAAHAIGWLRARSLSAGPCRRDRLLPDGRLASDEQTGWPIETPDEQTAAARAWRAWARMLGRAAARNSPYAIARRPARAAAAAIEEFDRRAGLVDLELSEPRALRFARETGRVAIAAAVDPRELPDEFRRRRSFVLLDAGTSARAAWAASLSVAGSRRHYFVPPATRSLAVRERAINYGRTPPLPDVRPAGNIRRSRMLLARAERSFANGHLASAIRLAGRAALVAGRSDGLRAEAVLMKARALRCNGNSSDAGTLIQQELQQQPAHGHAALLVEVAEASADRGMLEQAEAFARAALAASTTADGQARARLALDRARVWRGESIETEFWKARSAWHEWGHPPRWPGRGRYAHAPCGSLARWEWLCDRLERALWENDAAAIAKLTKQVRPCAASMPALSRARAEWLANGSPALAKRLGAHAVLQTGKAGTVMEIFEHMSALLGSSHEGGNDEDVIRSAVVRTRQMLRARSLAVYAANRELPIVGDGHTWNAPSALAARCVAVAQTAAPEQILSDRVAAVSIQSGGRPIGALVAAWPADAPLDARRVRLLLDAAALVIAPVLRSWSDNADATVSADMPEIVGVSAAINAVRDAVRRVARVSFPVLIEGESGVGKELVARAIHRLSSRSARPFRALNCAAMAEELVEAELFGHAQGAFTGARTARPGLFEDADRGSLFLDEVSDLSPRAQAKLLRVLQEGEVRRVGETAPRRIDVRVVAASNRSMAVAVEERVFRADLLFRLDVLRIVVPPLRSRPEDIPLLCAHFWREAAERAGTSASLSGDALARLTSHAWTGNVRELQNVIAAVAVAAPRRGRASIEHLPVQLRSQDAARPTLHQARATLERDLVRSALARAGGRPGRAAAELGLSRQGLAKLMRRLGLPAA